jgi:hypothetical protein
VKHIALVLTLLLAIASTAFAITNADMATAKSIAYQSYASAYGAQPTNACKAYVDGVSRTYLYLADLQAACGSSASGLEGCTYYFSQTMYVKREKISSIKVHAHEYLHVVLGCMRNNTDSGHTDPNGAWSYLALFTFGTS